MTARRPATARADAEERDATVGDRHETVAPTPVDPPPADRLAARFRAHGVAITRRELATALRDLDGLTPAQRRTVALMAARLAAGVLAPAGSALPASPAERTAIARLFDPDEHVREGR